MYAIAAVYAASIVYSVIRYIAFAPKNLENLPVFIVNKGVSMAAALCFAVGFLQQLRAMRGVPVGAEPPRWFRAGVFGAIVHIPISLAILRPAYFKEFFLEDRMTFAGEMVFLFGGLTAGMVYLLTRQGWSAPVRWLLSLGAMLTLLTHVLSMGYCRGLNINAAHAYMPPMWLLSAVGVAGAVLILLASRPARERPDDPRVLPPETRR